MQPSRASLIASLDIGSSAVKAGLVSADGRLHHVCSVAYPTSNLPAGEQHADDWWRAFVAVLQGWWSAGVHADSIAALTFSGQMQDLITLDAQGEPVRPAILYSDARAGAAALEIEQRLGRDEIHRVTRNPFNGASVLPKLLHLRTQESPAWARIRRIAVGAKDHVIGRLTGRHVTDPTTAATTGLYDIERGAWATDWLATLGLDAALLPELLDAGARAGGVTAAAAASTGLRLDCPVLCGLGDAAATTLGAGLVDASQCYAYLGTSGWVARVSDRWNAPGVPLFVLPYLDEPRLPEARLDEPLLDESRLPEPRLPEAQLDKAQPDKARLHAPQPDAARPGARPPDPRQLDEVRCGEAVEEGRGQGRGDGLGVKRGEGFDERRGARRLAAPRRILIGPVSNAGLVHRWALELLDAADSASDEQRYAAFEREVAAALPDPRLLFLPYLASERLPVATDGPLGTVTGMSAATTRAQLMRAALEGVSLSLRWSMELLQAQPAAELVVVGGATRSAVWMQTLTDVFDTPLRVPAQADMLACLGAAATAAVALGWCDRVEAFVLRPADGSVFYMPDPDAAASMRHKSVAFRRLQAAVAGLAATGQ